MLLRVGSILHDSHGIDFLYSIENPLRYIDTLIDLHMTCKMQLVGGSKPSVSVLSQYDTCILI